MVLQRLQKTALHRCQLAKQLVSACPSALRVVSVISSVDFFAFAACSLEEAETVPVPGVFLPGPRFTITMTMGSNF